MNTAMSSTSDKPQNGVNVDSSSSSKDDESNTARNKNCSRWFRCKLARLFCKCVSDCRRKWPRAFAMIVGVILPLLGLIVASYFFGFCLARLEEAREIESNDASIAAAEATFNFSYSVGNLTAQLPRICMDFLFQYIERREVVNQTLIEGELERFTDSIYAAHALLVGSYLFGNNNTQLNLSNETLNILNETFYATNGTLNLDNNSYTSFFDTPLFNYTPFGDDSLGLVTVNVTEAMDLMGQCGNVAKRVDELLFDGVANAVEEGRLPIALSFDWVRCDGDADSLDRSQLRPEEQQRYAIDQWRQSQATLYNQYLQEFLGRGVGVVHATIQAREESYRDATGFETCAINLAASAFFWFTVMTTIGYGNQAPSTTGGRAMVYTLGFLSILSFAGILANAGGIVTTIVDDWNHRMNRNWLNKPWVGCFLWGSIYYGWMVIIAVYTQHWKNRRMGQDFPFDAAYWLAYISTTTVGLGDFFYESEVILVEDILVLPILFLCGFVLLSNFLHKCSEFARSLMPAQAHELKRSLEEDIHAVSYNKTANDASSLHDEERPDSDTSIPVVDEAISLTTEAGSTPEPVRHHSITTGSFADGVNGSQ